MPTQLGISANSVYRLPEQRSISGDPGHRQPEQLSISGYLGYRHRKNTQHIQVPTRYWTIICTGHLGSYLLLLICCLHTSKLTGYRLSFECLAKKSGTKLPLVVFEFANILQIFKLTASSTNIRGSPSRQVYRNVSSSRCVTYQRAELD